MPIEYRYDAELNAVVTNVTGVLQEGDAFAHLRNLLDDPDVPSGYVEIVDFSSADGFAIKSTGASVITSLLPELRSRKDYRGTVFYAPSDVAFGIARIFRELVEVRGMSVDVYRTLDETTTAMEVLRRSRE
jgi:hypothetical protein